ncbi:MAG: Cna B-type domain-containing protein [Bacillota bacterium]|nr:Cna B-type domain-containing protein [Bacillota bacterium]
MRKSCKAIFSFAFALLLVMGLASTAFAAGPSITFEGFSGGFDFGPDGEHTETDLFDSFKGVMPGDILTEEITFTNAATDCAFVNLYMRAEAHDEDNPLSEEVAASGETVATMTEFLSQLSMKVWNGSELIYDASPDELDGLQDNKFLGTFRTGETTVLKVELTVPIDLDNRFANRMGEVDWIFLVEAFDESELIVRKIWSDGNGNHADDSVSITLLKDGQPTDETAELNASNGWTYTFERLLEGHVWSVEEDGVPEGYTVSYETEGNTVFITNTLIPEETTTEPVETTPPEQTEPDEVPRTGRNDGPHWPALLLLPLAGLALIVRRRRSFE